MSCVPCGSEATDDVASYPGPWYEATDDEDTPIDQ